MAAISNPQINAAEPAQNRRGAMALALANALAFALLIASEAFFFALSLDWSLAGLLHFGPVLYLPLGIILGGGAVWATVWSFRRAWAAERRLAQFGDASL